MEDQGPATPKEAVLRDMHRKLSEQRWSGVLKAAQEGRHVSVEYLLHLTSRGGIPEFAGSYAADRLSGKVAPPGRPARPPLDPSDLDTLWYHFDAGPLPWERESGDGGIQRLFPSQFRAVWVVRHWAARYAAFETRREPHHTNKPRLRYIASRGVWRVRNPKGEARQRVASLLNVSPATLAQWERRVRAWVNRPRKWPFLRPKPPSKRTKINPSS